MFKCVMLVLGLSLCWASLDAKRIDREPLADLYVVVDLTYPFNGLDAFHYVSRATEQAFQEAGYPGVVKVVRWSANATPPGVPFVRLGFAEWRQFIPGTLEFRAYGTFVDADGAKTDLGVYSGEIFDLATRVTSTRYYDAYLDAARKAMNEVVKDLRQES